MSFALSIQTACIWEVAARKLGNVHPRADFSDTDLVAFLVSAAAVAPVFDSVRPHSVGRTIELAVAATHEAVGRNTNLGIVLLLAPLAAAAPALPLRDGLRAVLDELTIADAECVFRAIRLANPGGLGEAAQQDVRSTPTATLLEAMALAADRDTIARQYATDFAEVFDFGVPALLDAFHRFGCVEAAIVDSQLRWLAESPDSLIARKNGAAVAAEVQRRAGEVLHLGGIASADGRRAGAALDQMLRSDGNRLNPGTTADLIAACLFVALRENKLKPFDPFPWKVEDWL